MSKQRKIQFYHDPQLSTVLTGIFCGLVFTFYLFVTNDYTELKPFPAQTVKERTLLMIFFLLIFPGSLYCYNSFIRKRRLTISILFKIYWVIVALLFLGDGLYYLLNAKLDNKPATILHTEIIQKYIGSNRSPSQYLIIKDRYNNKYVLKITNSKFFRASSIGDKIILQVKPGYWRTRWVQFYIKTNK